MKQNEFTSSIDRLLDGQLSPAAKAQLENTVATDPEAKKTFEAACDIAAACEQLGETTAAPEGFADSVMKRIEAEPKPRRAWPKAAKIGATIAACAAGVLVLVLTGSVLLLGGMRATASDSAGYAQSAPMANGAVTESAKGDYKYFAFSGATSNSVYDEPAADIIMDEAAPMEPAERDTDAAAKIERKIIKNADIGIETVSFDDDWAMILSMVDETGGYAQSTSIYGTPLSEGRHYGRTLELCLRIPAESFDAFISFLQGEGLAGTVTSYRDYSDDITDSYYDVATRLSSYEAQYDAIEKLLKKADNMSDIITIQQELSYLQYEMDALKGSLNRWDLLVANSTINLSLYEVADPATIVGVDPTLGERISAGFARGLNNFVEGFENFVVWVASSLIGIVIFAAIVAVAAVLIVRRIKKRKPKAE